MKKVLIISYNFPPSTGSGIHRPAKYAKYLSKFGWQPFVITTYLTHPFLKEDKMGIDHDFVRELKDKVKIDRVTKADIIRRGFHFIRLGRLITFFEIPDCYIWWLIPGYLRAYEVIKNEDIDLIYTTSPPATNNLIGYLLKKTTKLPWVADFRDEWSKNPFKVYPYQWQKKANQWFEKKVLSRADLVITTTRPYRNQFLEINNGQNPEKFKILTNGYDHQDFQGRIRIPKNHFSITYTGLLYLEQKADKFVKAIKELASEKKIGDDFIFNMVGGDLHDRGLLGIDEIPKEYWKNYGYLSHVKAVKIMRQSTAQLLIVDRSRGEGNIPGKTFEYLATGRPILALLPKRGEAAKIIKKFPNIYMAAPDNFAEIKTQLYKLYRDYKNNRLITTNPKKDPEILKYRRDYQTRELAKYFDSLLAKANYDFDHRSHS